MLPSESESPLFHPADQAEEHASSAPRGKSSSVRFDEEAGSGACGQEFDFFSDELSSEIELRPSKPCVGCGWCCMSDQCEVSHRKYGYMRRCPDLFWDEAVHRYVCLLMQDPDEGEAARRELFEGLGCCAPLSGWRDDVRNRDVTPSDCFVSCAEP